jgi:hypothetical protein
MGSAIVLTRNAFNGKVVLDGSFAIGIIENWSQGYNEHPKAYGKILCSTYVEYTNNLNMGVKLGFQLIIQQWTLECIIYILVIRNGHFLYGFINLAISVHLCVHRGQCLHLSTSFVMTFEYM